MAFTFNGVGTTFCGACDLRPDGSFVTTEWFAVLAPIFPLRSFRLVRVGERDVNYIVYYSESYAVLEKMPIYWPQVFRVYAFMGISVAWWFATGWLFFSKLKALDSTNAAFPALAFFAVATPPFAASWWLRRKAFRVS